MTGGEILQLARPAWLLPLSLPELGLAWCLLAACHPVVRRPDAWTLALLFPPLSFLLNSHLGRQRPFLDDFDAILAYMNHPRPERVRLLATQPNERGLREYGPSTNVKGFFKPFLKG